MEILFVSFTTRKKILPKYLTLILRHFASLLKLVLLCYSVRVANCMLISRCKVRLCARLCVCAVVCSMHFDLPAKLIE